MMQLIHVFDQMMKSRVIAAAIAVGAAAAPAIAWAEPQCETVCTPTSSCGKLCWDSGEKLTCGQWGVCNAQPPPPVCTPNWQPVSTSPAGFVHYNVYDPSFPMCRIFQMTKHIEQDVNHCNPQQAARQWCTPQVVQEQYSTCCFGGCTPQIQDYSSC